MILEEIDDLIRRQAEHWRLERMPAVDRNILRLAVFEFLYETDVPKLVILDEPTAALGVAQTAQVLSLVRRLADAGLAVILISHNMNDVLQVADNIAVLYLGQMAAQVDAKDVTHGQIVELITAGRSGDIGLQPEQVGAQS